MANPLIRRAALALLLLAAAADAPPEEPRLLTSHPAPDYDATVSGDGRWLVYTSERDGIPALYRRDLRSQKPSADVRLFPHPGRTSNAAFLSGSDRLVLYSERDDALGDVYTARARDRSLRRLSAQGVTDTPPRLDATGRVVTWEIRKIGREDRPAAWSPDAEVPPQPRSLPAPPYSVLSIDQPMGVALLNADDTNADGILDVRDDASVWEHVDGRWLPATFPLPGARSITRHPLDGAYLIAADWGGGIDIARVESPEVSRLRTPEEAQAAARAAFRRFDLERAAFLFRLASLLATDGETAGAALSSHASLLNWLERHGQLLSETRPERLASLPPESRSDVEAQRALALLATSPEADEREAARRRIEAWATDRAAAGDTVSAANLRLGLARSLARRGDHAGALRQTDLVLELAADDTGRFVTGRALLLRAEIYAQQGLADNAADAVRRLVADPDLPRFLGNRAGDLLVSVAMNSSGDPSAHLAALRRFASEVSGAPVPFSRLRLEEGRLLRRIGTTGEQQEALRDVLERANEAPALAAEAAALLAGEALEQRRLQQALAVYTELHGLLVASPELVRLPVYDQVRREMIRVWLAKGRREQALGDPLLAASTYAALLEVVPGEPSAWRGRLAALSGQPETMRLLRDQFRGKAGEDRATALDHYKFALAESYLDVSSRHARRAVDDALALQPDVPHFHLLRGFLYEQLYRTTERRGSPRRQWLEQANFSYQQAQLFGRNAIDDAFRADALLNAGNAAFLLRQWNRARLLYRQRSDAGEPFPDSRTALAFHYNRGLAAFRARSPVESETAFSAARALLPNLVDRDLMTRARARDLRLDLLNREALALMDASRIDVGISRFGEVAALSPENSLVRLRALRNQAVLLQRSLPALPPAERRRALDRSWTLASEALALAESGKVRDTLPALDEGGPFSLDFVFSTDAVGGSAQADLDLDAERRLLGAILARVAFDRGDHGRARQLLAERITNAPPITDANRAYQFAAQTVDQDRLAVEFRRKGDAVAAFDRALDGFQKSRFEIHGAPFVNSNAATRLLARLAEATSALAPPRHQFPDTSELWILGDPPPPAGDASAHLDEAARRLLALPDPAVADGSVPLVTRPVEEARLVYTRGLAAAGHARSALHDLGDAGDTAALETAVRAVAAVERLHVHARDLRSLLGDTAAPEEVAPLWIQLAGETIELEGRLGGHPEPLLRSAHEDARRFGWSGWSWWLTARAALAGGGPEAVGHAREALRLYRESPLLALPGGPTNPWPVLDRLEAILLRDAIDREDWPGAWDAAEEVRAARLRWMADQTEVVGSGDEDTAWLRLYGRLQEDFRQALMGLRRLPESASTRRAAALGELDRLTTALRDHLRTGREQVLPSALFHDPPHAGFDYIDAALEVPSLFPRQPVAVLRRRLPGVDLAVVYTADGARPIAPGEHLPRDAFCFGMGIGDQGLEILGGEAFHRQLGRLLLTGLSEPVALPDETGRLPDGDALALASEARAALPLVAMGNAVAGWSFGDGGPELARIARATPNLSVYTMALENRTILPDPVAELALAGWFAQRGLVQLRLDGAPWLGVPLGPGELPDEAINEWAEARGRFNASLDRGDWLESTRALRRSIEIQQALGETGELAADFNDLTILLGRLGRWKEASEAAERLLNELRDRGDVTLAALRLAGDVAARARLFDTALGRYSQAASLADSLGDSHARFEIETDIAITLENAGRHREALERFASARAMAETLGRTSQALRQDLRRARVLRLYLNRYDEAARLLEDVVLVADSPELVSIEIDALLALCRVQQAIGAFERSTETIETAALLVEELPPADRPFVQGQIALERANIAWYRADYFAAFREQDVANRIGQEIGSLALQVAARNISGLTSWSLNDLGRAESEFETALEAAREYDVDAEIATTLNNLGILARSRGDYDEALRRLRNALEIDEALGNRWGIAYSERNIGMTLRLDGRADDAIGPLERAVALSREIGDPVNEAKALLALADARADLGRADAETAYNDALAVARDAFQREVEWRALHGLGRLALREGDPRAAVGRFEDAAAIVDTLRASIRIQEFQEGFLLDKLDLYDEMVSTRLALGEERLAFESSERGRGRNFIDLLGNRRLDLADVEDKQLLDRHADLRSRLEAAERAVAAAPVAERPARTEELATLRREFTDFLVVLRAASPQLANFVEVEPAGLDEIQSLLDPGSRLVVYHLLGEESVAWVVGPETLETVRLGVGRQRLESLVGGLRERLQDFLPVDEQLTELGALLLEPLAASLAGAQRVAVVPHRSLHLLPFAPLRFADGSALLDRHAVYTLPTSSLLRYTVSRRRSGEPELPVLAIGNPERGDLMNLPFAEKEAERLRFDAGARTIRVGPDATETWLREHLADYAIVHIASHGEYDPDTPLFSAVLLAPDERNDGVLSAQEIFGLRARADLVALSACQTGLGRVGNGDDIVGLNRAFVYAGTRQLMTTLWRVDDVSTAILFKHFYRNARTMDRAEALRRAQLELRSRPEYRHPAHWAGLILSGDWQ